ncbi:hypothetical protein HD806DRAFT_510586 [Xylariaceae sp. AK1471]|nr:hypothetical protein HD806DRAFT_510586 [Xylariaceae sp. AK1471]
MVLAILDNFIMTTPHTQMPLTANADGERTSTRRNSAATEVTLIDNTYNFADKFKDFEDDSKTLSDLPLNGSSSEHSKTRLSGAVAKLKSKLRAKDEKPKQKAPIPPDYYPNNLVTFRALDASRI